MSAATPTRHSLAESHQLSEASLADGKTLHLTLLREGFNTARSRYYTADALRSGVAAFRDAQQYANHPTVSEVKERPEGDIRDWVATLTDVRYDESDKALKGTAVLHESWFIDKVRLMDEAGVLPRLGVSIRAVGEGEDVVMEGARTFRVDDFIEGISVDYVTRPGAGGGVEFRESDPTHQEDDMSAEIAAAEKRAAEAELRASQAEERAKEAEAKVQVAEEAHAIAKAAVEKMLKEAEAHAAQAAIGKLIDEAADVPDSGKEYLRKSLAEETDAEKAKGVIAAFAEAVKGITPNGVRGMGGSDEAGETREATEKRITDIFGGKAGAA